MIRDGESSCEEYRDELAELSLGILTGKDRARLLAHLEGCERCAGELAELAVVADRLTIESPDAEPPPGFEVGVLERIRSEPRRRSFTSSARARIAIAVAAAAVALVAAFVTGRMTGSSGESYPVAHAIAPATEPNLRVGVLTSAGHVRGDVYTYSAGTPWLLMTVQDLPAGGEITCEVTTASGRTLRLGSFWLTSGSGSWASRLPVAASALRSAQVVAADGTVLARATLSV